MNLCAPGECTGCMACVNICPSVALNAVEDAEGFLHPQVNLDLCTDCLLCETACPVLHPVKFASADRQEAYACWSNDPAVRTASSSGGAFTELAKEVLSDEGVVYGAALDAALTVYHSSVDNLVDLEKLRGSKYVQSRIDDCYQRVKLDLVTGREVLFSGTPCQVAGLKAFLGQAFGNLYTVDIACHGVPSPKLFEDYKEYMGQKLNNPIQTIRFRDKKFSWIYYNMLLVASNGKAFVGKYFSDVWIRGFLRDNFVRPSCYRCPFATSERVSDVTIADSWGYKKTTSAGKGANELGVSLVITNTKKGRDLFDRCKPRMTIESKSLEEARRTNKPLQEPSQKPQTRDEFWNDYDQLGFSTVVKKWMRPEKVLPSIYLKSNFKQTGFVRLFVFGFRCIEAAGRRVLKIFQRK